jgi:hypothetical protein
MRFSMSNITRGGKFGGKWIKYICMLNLLSINIRVGEIYNICTCLLSYRLISVNFPQT